jgi:hypothetical protein
MAQSGVPNAIACSVTDSGHNHDVGSIADAGHQHALSGLATAIVNDPGHSHTAGLGNIVVDSSGTTYVGTAGDSGTTSGATNNSVTGLSVNLTGNTDSGNASLSGATAANVTGILVSTIGVDASTAHDNMPPFACYNFGIYAGV